MCKPIHEMTDDELEQLRIEEDERWYETIEDMRLFEGDD